MVAPSTRAHHAVEAVKACSQALKAAAAGVRALGYMTECASLTAAAEVARTVQHGLLAALPADAISAEVECRQRHAEPVLREKVAAAAEGRQAELSGDQRAGRNLAEHHGFGCGSGGVEEMMKAPRVHQRGGRSKRRGIAMHPAALELQPSPADGSQVGELEDAKLRHGSHECESGGTRRLKLQLSDASTAYFEEDSKVDNDEVDSGTEYEEYEERVCLDGDGGDEGVSVQEIVLVDAPGIRSEVTTDLDGASIQADFATAAFHWPPCTGGSQSPMV